MRQIESFFWGIVAALGALTFELFLFIAVSKDSALSFSQFFIIPQFIISAALIEETFKYLIISKRIALFSPRGSRTINSFFVGLGFFAAELAVISMAGTLPDLQFLAEIAVVHVGTASLMGYMATAGNPWKIATLLKTIVLATAFHGIYNFLNIRRGVLEDYAVFSLLTLLVFINIVILLRNDPVLAQD